ncbi:hypothetical protein [uncultured Winogradskyella sp.]|uniref:hypothetical protein n=1 Tax=uncultured Winogradskyella sp. TaxID=395353 RepID=UPI0026117FAC|nr:hypothetical protein [uncultured Winogradskyella sp.]
MILELLTGMAIGFGLGVLIMIVVSDYYEENQGKLLNDIDQTIHESGFIDIPLEHMYQVKENHNPELRSRFLKRIQQFKSRNRFYN